jgi:cysteinyl-tRNA synthetase
MKIYLYNTLGYSKQEFKPIKDNEVSIYGCGPTVYNYQHIGNMRTYIFEDLLKRMFLYNGYKVKHVDNITDVGHLTSNADEGEDKMEEGAKREGKTVWDIAKFYTEEFMLDLKRLNILEPDVWCKATEHIKEQIELVKCLEAKGFTYIIENDGVYFDTSKVPNYGELANLKVEGIQAGKRIELHEEKRNKTDFALWKFSPKDKQRQMEWDSPWGRGFPGWHIECSAMSMKYLGSHFDIHCGGVDHISIHHTNEITQSEACTGEKFVNYWLHGEFLIDETGKMSKSKGEFLRIQTLIDKGYDPLDFRYLCLGTYYRKHLQFSFENLDAARNGYQRLRKKIIELKKSEVRGQKSEKETFQGYKNRFSETINDDLNVPGGLGILWEALRDDLLTDTEKIALAYDFDNVFGLRLKDAEEAKQEIPFEVMELVKQRAEAKKNKDWKLADELRNKVKVMGYEIVDKKEGVEVKKTQ